MGWFSYKRAVAAEKLAQERLERVESLEIHLQAARASRAEAQDEVDELKVDSVTHAPGETNNMRDTMNTHQQLEERLIPLTQAALPPPDRHSTAEDGRPPGNGWRIGRSGQWRRSVAAWMLDREGLHALAAVLFVAIAALVSIGVVAHDGNGYSAQAAFPIFFAIWVVLTAAFFVYEIVEDWRIRDQAYRDLMGWKQGTIPALITYGVAHLLGFPVDATVDAMRGWLG